MMCARTTRRGRRARLAAPALALAAALAPAASAAAAPAPPLGTLSVELPGVLNLSLSLGAGPGSTADVSFSIPLVALQLVKVQASRLLGIPGLEGIAPSLALNSDAAGGVSVGKPSKVLFGTDSDGKPVSVQASSLDDCFDQVEATFFDVAPTFAEPNANLADYLLGEYDATVRDRHDPVAWRDWAKHVCAEVLG